MKKCWNCGYENQDNARNCAQCGALLGEAANPNDYYYNNAPAEDVSQKNGVKKLLNNKPLLFGGIAGILVLLALLAAVIIAVANHSGSPYILRDKSVSLFYLNADREYALTYGGDFLDKRISESDFEGAASSMDGKVFCVYEDDTLYGVVGKSVFKITDDVADFGVSAKDGSVVWYIDEDDTLYTFSTKSKKATKIAEDTDPYSVSLSPDGRTIMYTSDDEGYIWRSGKTTELGSGTYAITSTNNGKTVYFTNDNDALYATDAADKNRNKITSSVDDGFVNADGTELVFTSEGKTYVTVNGKEKIKISGNELSFAPPLYYIQGNPYSSLKTVKGAMFTYYEDGGQSIGYLNNKYEFVRLSKNVERFTENPAQNCVFYLKRSDLYMKFKKEDAEEIKLAEDVDSYVVSENGKTVYYIDSDDDLYAMPARKGGKPKKIAEDIEDLYCFKNVALFMSDEDTLYRANGTKKVKIEDDVDSIRTYTDMFSYSLDEDQVFYSKDGVHFKAVYGD